MARKKPKYRFTGSKRIVELQERAMRASDLIREIATRGRRFFSECGEYHQDKAMTGRISYFEVNDKGHIFFINAYSLNKIYLNKEPYYWRNWSHGGTLKNLVEALRDYIKTGEPIRGYLGPAPSWYSNGDPWAYGEEAMGEIRQAAIRLGISKKPQQPPAQESEALTNAS